MRPNRHEGVLHCCQVPQGLLWAYGKDFIWGRGDEGAKEEQGVSNPSRAVLNCDFLGMP